jgi:chemotaxis-related protein WspD
VNDTPQAASTRREPKAADGHGPAEIVDCWKTIGNEGDGTCPDLQSIVHCRNCAAYAGAGARLLDRPMPADYRRERTEHFAARRRTAGGRISALAFRIGTAWLCLATTVLQEVAECRAIHSIPHRRNRSILGLVNVRGELLLCVSVGWLLGLVPGDGIREPRGNSRRLLVVAWEGKRLAFPADEVHGIIRFQREQVSDPPSTVGKGSRTFTQGMLSWEGRTIAILNAGLLLSTLNQSLS